MYIMFISVGKKYIGNGIRSDSLVKLHEQAAEKVAEILDEFPRALVTIKISKYI